jgi:hypothetical protein
VHQNIIRLKAVNQVLTQMDQEFVFVGGAVTSLYTDYIDDNNVRPTDDVDVIVELATYQGYSALDEKLRAIGNSPNNLLTYLRTEFSNVLDTHAFEEGLTAHLSRENQDMDENNMINLLRNALSIPPPFRGYTR